MALVTSHLGTATSVPAAAPIPMDNSMPGLGSFIVFAFLAIALYFLLKNMNARLRRMSYREKERIEAEEAARTAQAQTGAGTVARAEADGADPTRGEASEPEASDEPGGDRATDPGAPRD